MISTTEAWQKILAHARPLDAVRLPLSAARGRILRIAIVADSDFPPFDASAMDGYALRRADAPGNLRVVGTSQAGLGFSGTVNAGECVRIFTGAPVPAGADWVIKQEEITREGDVVTIPEITAPDFIRRRGENRRQGDEIVPRGTLLGPAELAALASAGVHEPEVSRAPRCVHLVTGNELVDPEQAPTGAQIRDSNSTLIAALLASHGVELAGQMRVGDNLETARSAVEKMPASDLLLISGGASVGDLDLARPLLESLGYTLHFHQVNLRPGRPTLFASRGKQLAVALPGNPVSHWVVFQLFIAPLLHFLQTGVAREPVRLRGRLAAGGRLPPSDARHTFWPSRVAVVDGGYEITTLPLASSGDSSGLVGANALLPIPAAPDSLSAGQLVEFISCP